MLPYDVANHLAKHLARQILLKRPSNVRLSEDKELWSEGLENEVKAQILSDVQDRPKAPVPSEQERIRQEVEALNQAEDMNLDSANYETKKEVMDKLKELGVPFEARKTKAELQKELARALQNTAPIAQ